MGRKREIIIDEDEDVVAYEHHLSGKFVRILVGFGTAMPDGSFVAAESQNFENFIVQGEAYETLLAATETKPAGVFRKGDLWNFVDLGRAAMKAEREKAKEGFIVKTAPIEEIQDNVKLKNNP